MLILGACTAHFEPVDPVEVRIEADPDLPTALVARWDERVGEVDVVYAQGRHGVRMVTVGAEVGEVRLPALRAGERVEWQVRMRADGFFRIGSGQTEVAPPSADLPRFVVQAVDWSRSEVVHGSLVLSHFEEDLAHSWATAIDGDGGVRFAVEPPSDRRVTRARLSRDGRSVLYSTFLKAGALDGSEILRVPLDGAPGTVTSVRSQHHDFVETDTGFTWIAFEEGEAVIDGEVVPLLADRIYRGPEGATEETVPDEVFSFRRDYGVEPWWTCSHMDLGWWVAGYHDWNHTNSLALAPDGGLFVLARHIDALLRLEPDGRVRWQLGGRDGTLSLGGDEPDWSHPHFSYVDGDRILVFDDRDHDPGPSRVVEFEVDEAMGHAELVWSWETPVDVSFLGDAQRLPGGNTLVALGPAGRMVEVTPAGDIVWDMVLEPTNGVPHTVARVEFVADLGELPP